MIKTKQQDILLETKGILVHGCNLQGVMGSGIAKSIKDKYPKVFLDYSRAIDSGAVLGEVVYTQISSELIIASAITQEYYGRKESVVYVSYEAIKDCFKDIYTEATTLALPVIFPKIGCGLANGDWDIVSDIIEEQLPNIDKTLFTI